jgi:hypothetical protein
MTGSTDPTSEESAVVKKHAEPASVPEELEEEQAKATFGWLRTIWNWIRGQTASEARRLKEAGVRAVEGEAAKRVNEAKKLDAEAEKMYAETEQKRQEAALLELQRRKQEAQLEGEQLEKDIERAERIADAAERVEKAISTIRQKGGDVAFDTEQLKRLLEAELERGEEE